MHRGFRCSAVCSRSRSAESVFRSVYAAIDVVRAAPARVDVELAPHAVDAPLQVAVLELREEMNAAALEVEVTRDETAEMGRVRDAATRPAHRRAKRHGTH